MKNFVVLGLLLIGIFVGSGCGAYVMSSGKDRFGNVRLVTGTPVLGSNIFNGTLTIDNNTQYPFYVYKRGFCVSVDADKITPVMVGPRAHFFTEDNTALVGEFSTWTLIFRDNTDSRTITTLSEQFQMRVQGGVITNTWTVYEDNGRILGRPRSYISSYGHMFGGIGYRY